MNKGAKIIPFLLTGMIFISSCNNSQQENSPFAGLLSQPPYETLTDSLKKEPRRDDLFFRRAVLLNGNGFPEPALADFQKAWALSKNEKYAVGISKLLLDKKPDSAIAFIRQALKELPQSFLLQLTMARAQDAIGKTDEALQTCNELLRLNPQQVDVLKFKAALLDKGDRPEESIKVLELAYSLTPYDIELNYSLANKYAEEPNAKVLQLCDSLIKADSLGLHPEPYYLKGVYYSNTEENDKAISAFNTAIQKDYQFANAYIEKGKILYNEKKYAEALKVFQLCSSIKPAFPDAYYWTGMCLEATGEKENAGVNYRRAYELDKSFTEAKEAMDRLGK